MNGVKLFVFFSACCFFVAGVAVTRTLAGSGDADKGKRVYDTNCLICHGEGGKGDGIIGASLSPPPTDLTGLQVKRTPDADLLAVIREGRATMPAWKKRLTDQDIQNVLMYVRTLEK